MSQFVPSENTIALVRQIGRNLRVARKRRRKTIAQVAEMAGVSVSTIKRVESGDHTVKFGIFLTIAEIFQLDSSISLADPAADVIGATLEKQRLPQRIRNKKDSRLDF